MIVDKEDLRRLYQEEQRRLQEKIEWRWGHKARFNEECFRDAKGHPQTNNWHHLMWFKAAEYNGRLLVEAAREHAKTQVFGITQPLYEIFNDPNVRVLIVSDIYGKAQERCKVLKEHIQQNRYIRDFRAAR